METHVVIMAGGIGSRFWPMSTPQYPKQFIDVMGVGRTMIQLTFDRFCKGEGAICTPDRLWVVTSASYVDIVREQLPEVPAGNILAEPAARNTAPCIAYASWKIASRTDSANIVVTPSDALVLDVTEYRRVIREALACTAGSKSIVTVGIKPTRPETGYGYVEAPAGPAEIRKVSSFKEKPDLETARRYVSSADFLWNAGIFVWNLSSIMCAIRAYAPQIAAVMDNMASHFGQADELSAIEELFPTCEKISIDYAVMEKSPDILTIPGDFGWSDLGTWGSLWTNLHRDCDGNAVVSDGEVRLYECRDCVVHLSGDRLTVLQGLDDCIVAQKDGRLLICKKDQEQRIKDFSK